MANTAKRRRVELNSNACITSKTAEQSKDPHSEEAMTLNLHKQKFSVYVGPKSHSPEITVVHNTDRIDTDNPLTPPEIAKLAMTNLVMVADKLPQDKWLFDTGASITVIGAQSKHDGSITWGPPETTTIEGFGGVNKFQARKGVAKSGIAVYQISGKKKIHSECHISH